MALRRAVKVVKYRSAFCRNSGLEYDPGNTIDVQPIRAITLRGVHAYTDLESASMCAKRVLRDRARFPHRFRGRDLRVVELEFDDETDLKFYWWDTQFKGGRGTMLLHRCGVVRDVTAQLLPDIPQPEPAGSTTSTAQT